MYPAPRMIPVAARTPRSFFALNAPNMIRNSPIKLLRPKREYVGSWKPGQDMSLRISLVEILDKQKDAILEGRYSDFTLLENVAVPYNITITDFQNNQRITIKYKNMAANKPDINIDFKLPDDVKIVKW